MARSVIDTMQRLVILGKEYHETTAQLIAVAQMLKPSIRNREEALQLAEDVKCGNFEIRW